MENRILLVTGASSDIGLGLIRAVHGQYDTVLAHYNRTQDNVMALRRELGEKVIPLQADFSDEASTAALAEMVLSRGLAPSHFVHLPACPLNNVKFAKTTWQTFDAEFSTAFRSAVMLCQAFLASMSKNKHGKIVLMLSHNVQNQPPIKYAVPYTSAKYALLGLVRSLAAEYADRGITVNGVSPSMVATKFLSGIPDLVIEKNAADSPLKRNLNVDDVIPAIVFLLSAGADCITGQNIAITGGN